MEEGSGGRRAYWTLLEPVRWTSENNVTLTKLDDLSLLATGDNPEHDTYQVTYQLPAGRITGLSSKRCPTRVCRSMDPAADTLRKMDHFCCRRLALRHAIQARTANDKSERPLKLANPTASIHQDLAAKAIDGDKLTGWHVRGGVGRRQCVAFEFAEPLTTAQVGEISVKLLQNFAHQQTIGRFRIWVTSDSGPLPASDMPVEVERTLLKPPAQWSDEEANQS